MTAENNKSKTKDVSTHEPELVKAPDGGYGWVVLVASFFVSFILDGVMYSFGIILDEIKMNVDAEESLCNLLSSLNTGFLFCSGPIVAGLANQFGVRSVVMGGAVVTAVMYMITAFTKSIYVMMVTYGVIGGVSTGCTYIASLIIIADYFDKKRGVATGITMAGSGVGSFVFPPLISMIIKEFEWRFAMSICACIILQTCVCGAFLRPLNPSASARASASNSSRKVEMKSLGQKGAGEANDDNQFQSGQAMQTYMGSLYSLNEVGKLPFHQRNSFVRITLGILKEMTDFRLLVQNMGFLLITLSNLVLFVGYFCPFLYITKMAENAGATKEKASLLISIIGIVNIPARMLYGFIADRRIISAINLNTFAVVCATVPLFFYFKMYLLYSTHIVFAVLFAIGIAGMNSLTTMYLCDLVGLKRFSNAMGIINLFRGFGCFLGPFLGGLVANNYGEISVFMYSAICFAAGLLLTGLVSFGSFFQACRKRGKADETVVEGVKSGDDSELNKNLLNKA